MSPRLPGKPIHYVRKTTLQVIDFLTEYVALCQKHQIHLSTDQDYNICPVIGGFVQRDETYTHLIQQTKHIGEI